MKYYRIQIRGKVQGVAFRYYSKLKAQELGLVGTTENLTDGSVVTHVKGDSINVDRFIGWCHEGSPAADVKEVITTQLSNLESQEYTDFSILR
jgi:acylphosphatase